MRNKAALIWEGEPGDRRTWTYFDLWREVNKFGNVLRGLGVTKGDRVAIYMPLIPEAVVAMLACARIGAIHSVVFGGFSAESLRDRILDAQAKVLVTADGGYRRGGLAPAQARCRLCRARDAVHSARRRRQARRFPAARSRKDAITGTTGSCRTRPRGVEPEPMDANDPLFILYTSGTTGKPKGITHGTGGYLTGVYASTQCGVRPQGRRRFLVHGRHRLGDRTLVRRVRPAGERARRSSSTRARPTGRTGIASGRSASATA